MLHRPNRSRRRSPKKTSRLEALESRRLLASTVSIPVAPALDGQASTEDVIDTPYGFGPNWFLDASGRTFFAGTPEQVDDTRGVMEFPIAGVPAGSRIESAALKFHVQDFRVGFEGSLPSVDFDGYAGDGQLKVQDAWNFSPLSSPARIASVGTAGRGEYSVALNKVFVQSLVGRASHLGIVAGNGAGTWIHTAEGAAAAKVTPPTLVLTFTPPSAPVPPPAPLPSGSIAGSIFLDADADGARDAGEVATAHFQAFLDVNRNGMQDHDEGGAETDDQGNFRFTGLAKGTYRVGVVVPTIQPGWRQTGPAAARFRDVTLSGDSASATVTGFGLRSDANVVIAGTLFDDTDRDGVRDAGEQPVGRRRVYLDVNNNGFFDTDDSDGFIVEEPNTYTDQEGHYYFYTADPGTQRVRVLPLAGVRQTGPAGGAHVLTLAAGQAARGRDFGSVSDSTVPPPPPPPPPPTPPNTINGLVFEDADADGVQDAGEKPLANVRVYVDANKNGKWDEAAGLEDEDEYWIMTGNDGRYRLTGLFVGLDPGAYRVRVDLSSSLRLTSPVAGFYDVTVVNGQAVTGTNFGAVKTSTPPPPPGGSIAGTVFADTDADGVKDAGERALANYTIYLDADGDQVYDAGERAVTTDADGNYVFTSVAPGSYRVCEVIPTGWQATVPSNAYRAVTVTASQRVTGQNFGNQLKAVTPPPPAAPRKASISGVAFDDANGDGVRQAKDAAFSGRRLYLDLNNDGKRQPGEPSVLSDRLGIYRFNGLAAGTYRVRADLPPGWRATGVVQPIAIAAGQAAADRHVGLTAPASISGAVFRDDDGNGARQAGEAGLANWRVFLDADRDGVHDNNEASVLTDKNGNYALRDLTPGAYTVRVVQQNGWNRTTPTGGSHAVVVAGGEDATGRLFGKRRIR
jgi:protocatechuate 3,4-dioxygenase beta subunit